MIQIDMEMPDSCYNCELHNYHFCDLTKTCIVHNWNDSTRAGDCPLKEVPENSVLEDIKAKIRHFMFEVNPSSSESDYACNYILDLINNHISGKD